MPQTGTAQVLRRLKRSDHPDLLVGTETLDDAGVFRLRDDYALVQTTDFFPPVVDDPYAFGRIAAANALSDVYAMGGAPMTALNIVCFPDHKLELEILSEILRGGAETIAQAGAVLVGGHSVRDEEVKYGLAVTGFVHPERILTNAGARPGDVLILTKPIGSGVLTSAAKKERLAPAALEALINVMTALNRCGVGAAAHPAVHGGTDVTGFGLLGHAHELASASGVTIEIAARQVPLLEPTLELAAGGFLTRAWKSTREHIGAALEVAEGVDPLLVSVLLDAQTSGGLLLSVADDEAEREALVSGLMGAGAVCAPVIGRVREQDGPQIRLLDC